jgi:hypothetical protein
MLEHRRQPVGDIWAGPPLQDEVLGEVERFVRENAAFDMKKLPYLDLTQQPTWIRERLVSSFHSFKMADRAQSSRLFFVYFQVFKQSIFTVIRPYEI